MKKINLLMLACGLGLCTHAQQTFQLTGTLAKDSRKAAKQLYINYVNEYGDTLRLDSAKVKKGAFTFECAIPDRAERGFISGLGGRNIDFFLEPGQLTTNAIDARAPQAARVNGTPANDLYARFLNMRDANRAENEKKLAEFTAALPASADNDDKQRQAYIHAERQRMESLGTLAMTDFILDHIQEKAAVYLIHDYCQPFFTSYTMMRDILTAVPARYQQLPTYQNMLNQCRGEELKQGTEAPEVSGLTPTGERFSTTDLAGKYVLVMFWDSDDARSQEEAKYWKEAAKVADTYDKLALVGFSLDTHKEAWEAAIAAQDMNHAAWHHISTLQGQKSQVLGWYKIKALPYTILLNPKGQLVAHELKGKDIVTKVKRIAAGIDSYE